MYFHVVQAVSQAVIHVTKKECNYSACQNQLIDIDFNEADMYDF